MPCTSRPASLHRPGFILALADQCGEAPHDESAGSRLDLVSRPVRTCLLIRSSLSFSFSFEGIENENETESEERPTHRIRLDGPLVSRPVRTCLLIRSSLSFS